MAPDNRPKYSMAMVRMKTGLTDRQIRYYEEADLISPARTQGKQRIFTEEEIDRLLEIKGMIEAGLTIEGVKEVFAERERRLAMLNTSTPTVTQPSQRLAGNDKRRLTSLYPVSNRAQLVQLIVQRRRERAREKGDQDPNT